MRGRNQMNRQNRRLLTKGDKAEVTRKVDEAQAHYMQVAQRCNQDYNIKLKQLQESFEAASLENGKTIANDVLRKILMPAVLTTLQNDFNFTEEQLLKFGELFGGRTIEAVAEKNKESEVPVDDTSYVDHKEEYYKQNPPTPVAEVPPKTEAQIWDEAYEDAYPGQFTK